jgi:hypothetical protein
VGLLRDGTAGNGGRIQLQAPQPHCRVHLPGASRLVYCFSPAVGQAECWGFDRGRGQNPVFGEGTVQDCWVGLGKRENSILSPCT